MKIIKDHQIIENTWTFVADDHELIKGNVSVTLGRWKKDKAQILQQQQKIGIRLYPTDTVADLANDLEKIDLIELDFPVFKDGRGFSQARLLRGRYHFQGEIRATGNYMVDQIYYLSRVGVNAFEIKNHDLINTALTVLNDFSVTYQPSSC